MNTFSINGVHNESEQGLAWKSANSPKHKVSVLLDNRRGTNLISTKCCTRMGLGQPLPSTEIIADFSGKTIYTLEVLFKSGNRKRDSL